MRIPSWLYGLQKSEQLSHTHHSTGDIDVEFLLQNRPDFWLENAKEIPLKKKLIFCDFSIDRCKMPRKLELIEIFNYLLQHHFELYFWIDYSLIKIDKNQPRQWLNLIKTSDEAEDSVRAKIPFSREEDIITEAGRMGLGYDEILLLDYFKCRQLRHDCLQSLNIEDIHAIDVSDLYQCRISTNKQLSYFLQNKPTHFIKDIDDSDTHPMIKFLSEKLNLSDKRPLSTNQEQKTFDNEAYITIQNEKVTVASLLHFLANRPKLKEVTLLNCELIQDDKPINYEQLAIVSSKVTSMNFSYCQIEICLLDLLVNLPHLQALDFFESNEIDEVSPTLPWNKGALSKLIFLEMNICHLSQRTLSHLLQLSKIQVLKVIDCDLTHNSDCQQLMAKLTHLESFYFCSGEISSFTLESLLTNSKKLENVLIYHSPIVMQPNSQLLNSIIQAPNLRIFEHHHNQLITVNENLIIDKSQSSLKKLRLFMNIHHEILNQFLANLKNLEKLHLEGNVAYTDAAYEKIVSTLCQNKKLISFKTELNIPAQLIYQLLEQLPHLEKLHLQDYPYKQDLRDDIRYSQFHDTLSLVDSYYFSNQSKPLTQATSSDTLHKARSAKASSSLLQSSPKEISWDADTSLVNMHYQLKRIFYAREGKHPDPIYYRENIFEELIINDELIMKNDLPFLLRKRSLTYLPCAFKWVDSSQKILSIFKTTLCDEDIFYASKKILITPTWEALPSLSPHEKLTHVYIEQAKRDNIEISYGSDNCYHIRNQTLQTPEFLEIHFILQVLKKSYPLPAWLQTKIQDYQTFNAVPLKNVDFLFTGYDFIDAIKDQRTGSCRHRAICFIYDLMCTHKELSFRIVINRAHAWVEIFIDGHWLSCDLGGYPAIKEIDDTLTLETKLHSLEHINPHFKTWHDSEKSQVIPLDHYIRKILLNRAKNVLVEILPGEPTIALSLLLQEACLQLDKPCYYLDSPRDFVCSANWVDYQDNDKGILNMGPGGLLHQFLKDNIQSFPVIIVNLNNFKAEDIVRLNSFIDENRMIDGTPIPKYALVVCLYDFKNSNAYKGSDLSSRIDHKYDYTIDETDLKQRSLHLNPIDNPEKDPSTITLNLFNSPYWKNLLVGQWSLHGDELYFLKNILLKLSADNAVSIHIQNPPQNDADFILFWQLAKLHRKIAIANRYFSLPADIKLSFSKGYDEELFQHVIWMGDGILEQKRYPLNPTHFRRFFKDYTHKENKIFEKAGILAENAHTNLHVQLTRDLISFDQWAELLNGAKEHQIRLHIYTTDNIELKAAMPVKSQLSHVQDNTEKNQSSSIEPLSAPIAQVILTNDQEMAVLHAKQFSTYHVFDISESHSSEILFKKDLRVKREECRLEFKHVLSEVWQRLQQGENFILKGNFSEELIDSLSPFCFPQMILPQELGSPHFGKLLLISQNKKLFNGIPYQTLPFSKNDMVNALTAQFGASLVQQHAYCLSFNYTKASQILRYAKFSPLQNPLTRWSAAESGSCSQTDDLSKMDLSWEACSQFELGRLHLLREALSLSPITFIFGQTGIGKSTFVQKTLASHKDCHVYQSEEQFSDWATDHSPHCLKILLIDEFNLKGKNFSYLTGIFSNEILRDRIYSITPLHKIIFIGNPSNYSALRNLPTIFTSYGNAITFPELSPAFIYHKNLKPIFNGIFDEQLSLQLSETLLKCYFYIKGLDSSTILISARELEMLALEMLSQPNHSYRNALQLIFDFVNALLKPELADKFNQWFEKSYSFRSRTSFSSILHIADFILTKTHYPVYQQLIRFLQVRDFQQKATEEAKQFSGLGGMIFEGTSGNGKSYFVMNILKHLGYQKAALNKTPPSAKYYYHIPTSMAFEKKKALLLKAFHEGAIVLIDEINSCPMQEFEELLNSLLMGQDLQGKRATVPGFKLIGTQNSIDNPGRKANSLAVLRRLLTCQFPDYTLLDLIIILKELGLKESTAKKLSFEFMQAQEYAIAFNLKPLPNFRDLIKHVRQIVKSTKLASTPIAFNHLALKSLTSQAHHAQSCQPVNKKARKSVAP